MPLFPFWDTKIKHNTCIQSFCWYNTEYAFRCSPKGPLKKCPSRFDLTSESEIFIAIFSFFFAIHRSPCCGDYFPWQCVGLPCISIFRCPEWILFLSGWCLCKWRGSTSSFVLLRIQGYKMLLKQLLHSYIQNLLQGSLLPWQPDYSVAA